MKQRLRTRKKAQWSRDYDSGLEAELHNGLLQTWEHHPTTLPYVIERTYEPDFVKEINEIQFLCEAKGIFWDSTEAKKYKEIVKHLSPNQVFFFIFKDSSKPLIWSKKRKDGTKMTHAEWCDKNGFIYFDLSTYNSKELKDIAIKVKQGVKFYDNSRYSVSQ